MTRTMLLLLAAIENWWRRVRGLCVHDWEVTGPHGAGWHHGTCRKCGEKGLFS